MKLNRTAIADPPLDTDARWTISPPAGHAVKVVGVISLYTTTDLAGAEVRLRISQAGVQDVLSLPDQVAASVTQIPVQGFIGMNPGLMAFSTQAQLQLPNIEFDAPITVNLETSGTSWQWEQCELLYVFLPRARAGA